MPRTSKTATSWDYIEDFKGRDCKEQARKVVQRFMKVGVVAVQIKLTDTGCKLFLNFKKSES